MPSGLQEKLNFLPASNLPSLPIVFLRLVSESFQEILLAFRTQAWKHNLSAISLHIRVAEATSKQIVQPRKNTKSKQIDA